MNWIIAQNQSDDILASGITTLTNSPKNNFDLTNCSTGYGNYLIESLELRYIGEATNLKKRLKQHSKPNSSTFFKNYIKARNENPMLPQQLEIEDFSLRTMETFFGRKEIEEFGIVNLPANLNRFQKGKRKKYIKTQDKSLWADIQAKSDELLETGSKTLSTLKYKNWDDSEPVNYAGIYIIEHPKNGVIYIGESSNVLGRYGSHNDRAYISALRRNIARDILGYSLSVQNGKRRFLSDIEERGVSKYLSSCRYKSSRIDLGRCELEEYLIRQEEPLLNRKVNK